MREVDRVAIEELGPNLYQMMENAGRNLAVTVLETMGAAWSQTPIAVLSGTGGNGGGGICAARHLANRGADVTVVVSDSAGLTPVPSEQLAIYRGTAGRVVEPSALDTLQPGIIVDAVIGYSLRGAPRGVARRMIDWIGTKSVPVISLDVPSGIDVPLGLFGDRFRVPLRPFGV
jgi:NAD(P)H-hydrate epimerase